jgi:tmRNA-binding protein
VNIAIVKGKKNWDKRQTIKERDIKRELQRNGH